MNYERLNNQLKKNGDELREIGNDNHQNGYYGLIEELHVIKNMTASQIARLLSDIAGYEILSHANIKMHLEKIHAYNPAKRGMPTGSKRTNKKPRPRSKTIKYHKDRVCSVRGCNNLVLTNHRLLCRSCYASGPKDEFIMNQRNVSSVMTITV